jgi:hypothetical protein
LAPAAPGRMAVFIAQYQHLIAFTNFGSDDCRFSIEINYVSNNLSIEEIKPITEMTSKPVDGSHVVIKDKRRRHLACPETDGLIYESMSGKS